MFKSKISKEEIAALPGLSFDGEIVVVETEEMQEQAAAYLSEFPVLGFDTESRAVFKKGVKNHISLLQLSTEKKAFLFRLNKMRIGQAVARLLEAPEILKIGVAVRDDVRELQNAGAFVPGGFVDLQSLVGEWGIEDLSLQKITAIVLGGRLSKAQRLSNWNAANLTDAQLAYAATDAWVCLLIYRKFSESRGRRKKRAAVKK